MVSHVCTFDPLLNYRVRATITKYYIGREDSNP